MAEHDLDEVATPTLRADLLTPVVGVLPAEPVMIELQVLNTTPVIHTVQVSLADVLCDRLERTPSLVTLFPDESQRITITATFPRDLPAGLHTARVLVDVDEEGSVPAELTVELEVPAVPELTVEIEPELKVAGKKARYSVQVTNAGNTELAVQVTASDADKVLALYLSEPSLRLPVGGAARPEMLARGKRPWTGSPVEHVITVEAAAEAATVTRDVRFRQKARLTAGVITILTLASILVLWAVAMYFGVQFALAPAPPTKAVPEGFTEGTGLGDLDPTVIGGALAGTIVADSTAQPLPRVTIEAFDLAGELVSATATGDDGSYQLAGLAPARYRLRLRAQGFETVWWPDVTDPDDAFLVAAPAQDVADGLDVALRGLPGSLGGQVAVSEDVVGEVSVEVVAVDLLDEQPPVLTTADPTGVWSVTGLPTPATYRITFRTTGFAPVEVTQPLAGGEQLIVNPTRLVAADGSISGFVTDRFGAPLGGVEVVAQRGGDELGTITPTSGDVGSFTLIDLETPATYLLTFSLEGFASETVAVRLGPGENLTGLEVSLVQATGSIVGRVVSSAGRPLGGVAVSVIGGDTELTTDTFTSGDVGSFRVSGLPLPGIYTVTFTLDGFTRETVQVSLDRAEPEGVAIGVLTPSVGRFVGRVLDARTGNPVGAATVQVSDGDTIRETVTASAPASQAGRFSVSDLPPGTYTITATLPSGGSQTVLQTLGAAQTIEITLRVAGP